MTIYEKIEKVAIFMDNTATKLVERGYNVSVSSFDEPCEVISFFVTASDKADDQKARLELNEWLKAAGFQTTLTTFSRHRSGVVMLTRPSCHHIEV